MLLLFYRPRLILPPIFKMPSMLLDLAPATSSLMAHMRPYLTIRASDILSGSTALMSIVSYIISSTLE